MSLDMGRRLLGSWLGGLSYNLRGEGQPEAGRRGSYHELEEEPGVLQDGLSHGTAADHPLQGQLLVQQLGAGARVTESQGAQPVPSSGGGRDGVWKQWDGLGLAQLETMQERERKESAHPFPGPSRPCWASGETGAPGPTWSHPPPASHYLLHSESRLGGWWGQGGALEVGRGSARAAVDGL